MEKKNLLILILSFAALVIVGSLFVFFQNQGAGTAPFVVGTKPSIQTTPTIQTPQTFSTVPTTPASQIPKDWETYRNEEFGFAFDYPGEWDLRENKSASKVYAPLYISFFNSGGTINVLVLSGKFNPYKIIFDAGMEGTIEIKKENAWQNLRVVDVDSRKGYRFFGADGDCAGDFIQTPVKDFTLQIGFTTCVEDKGITENIKNTLISSLRFF